MTTITIVGVGALGSHVAMLLRNEGDLRVIDFDRVEQKNLLAQMHTKGSVGKNKAAAFAQLMQFGWSIKVIGIPHKLTGDNDDQLLSGSSLIIDCLDNGAGRRIVQNFARRSHTPCLHGALAADGSFGQVRWDDGFVIDDSAAGAATCEGGEHLPFIVETAAFIARAAQVFLASAKQLSFTVLPAGAHRV